MKKRLFLFIAIAVFCQIIPASCARAQEPDFPDYVGYVNDFAGILSNENKGAITALIGELERKTTAQIAVVTVGTVQPLDIEGYAVRLFEKWGIGQKGKDNGVLLLVAVRDRKVRIEVGYGLEGAIPDALAKVIIEDYIVQSFKAGDYNAGVAKGTVAISKLVAKEYDVTLSEFGTLPAGTPMPKKQTPLGAFLEFIFTLFIILLILSLRMGFFWWWLLIPGSYRRRGGYWYGGGFGGNSGGFSGGFGGFGGGFSGGGGASGGW